jgi:DNA-binding NarL/FixJ family response regulator
MNPHLSQPVRVLAVSDHPLAAWGLQHFLESLAPRAESTGTVPGAVEARRELGERPVDIIVVDLDGDIGIEAIADLATASPARVIALTASSELSLHDGAILAGARGVVTKSEPLAALAKAIERVHVGEFWIGRAATSRIFLHLAQRRSPKFATPDQRRIAALTEAERLIVAAIRSDASAGNRVLAERLGISEDDLRRQLESIYAKLGIASRLELFAYARLYGLAA